VSARSNGQESAAPAAAWVVSARERERRRLGGLRKFVRHKPVGAASAVILVVFVVAAAFAPWLAPHKPNVQVRGMQFASPGRRGPEGTIFLLGADQLGRDTFSRVIYGARLSLGIGFSSIVVSVLVGTTIGVCSGFVGGKIDLMLQRVIDAWMTIPVLILALLLIAVIGSSVANIVAAISITSIPRVARVLRGSTLSIKHNLYVDAARAVGCSDLRIMEFYILPNVAAPIIVIATVALSAAVLIEASLSFLGLGLPPPTATWGQMISDGRNFMTTQPRLLLVPAAMLSVAVFALNLLGDALRDVWDPRLRGS
jgi:peptide/nickel transport system permease protein